MPATSFGGSMNVMIFVDDFLRYKIVRFLKKSDAPTALRNIIIKYYIIPAGLTIGSVGCFGTWVTCEMVSDGGGRFIPVGIAGVHTLS